MVNNNLPAEPVSIRYSEQDFPFLEEFKAGEWQIIDPNVKDFASGVYLTNSQGTAMARMNQPDFYPHESVPGKHRNKAIRRILDEYLAAIQTKSDPDGQVAPLRALFAQILHGANLRGFDRRAMTMHLLTGDTPQAAIDGVKKIRDAVTAALFGDKSYADFLSVYQLTDNLAKRDLAETYLRDEIAHMADVFASVRMAINRVFCSTLEGKEVQLDQAKWREDLKQILAQAKLHLENLQNNIQMQENTTDASQNEQNPLAKEIASIAVNYQEYLRSIGQEPQKKEKRNLGGILEYTGKDNDLDELRLQLEEGVYFKLNKIYWHLKDAKQNANAEEFSRTIDIYQRLMAEKYKTLSGNNFTARTILSIFCDLTAPEKLFDPGNRVDKRVMEINTFVESEIAYRYLAKVDQEQQQNLQPLAEIINNDLDALLNGETLDTIISQIKENNYFSRSYFTVYQSYFTGICRALTEGHSVSERERNKFQPLFKRFAQEFQLLERYNVKDKEFCPAEVELCKNIALALIDEDPASENAKAELTENDVDLHLSPTTQQLRTKAIALITEKKPDPIIPRYSVSQATELIKNKKYKKFKNTKQFKLIKDLFPAKLHKDLDKALSFYVIEQKNCLDVLEISYQDSTGRQSSDKIQLFPASANEQTPANLGTQIHNTLKEFFKQRNKQDEIISLGFIIAEKPEEKVEETLAAVVSEASTESPDTQIEINTLPESDEEIWHDEEVKITFSEECKAIVALFPEHAESEVLETLFHFWRYGNKKAQLLSIETSGTEDDESGLEILCPVLLQGQGNEIDVDSYLVMMKDLFYGLANQHPSEQFLSVSPYSIEMEIKDLEQQPIQLELDV